MQEPLPADLAAVLIDCLALLSGGAAETGSAFRNLALGSIGLDGAPQVRTVVLRGFDAKAAWLEVHTDARSAKHAELRAAPVAALHGWDAAARVQLRASGPAQLHAGDEVARRAWASLREPSRRTYRVRPGPGNIMASADAQHAGLDEAAAFGVFCVIRLHIRALDWLHLAQGSHRRARFTWDHGAIAATWLAP